MLKIKFPKHLPLFEILLVAAVLSIYIYAALSDSQNFSLRWFTRDDAFYYYKVAQNISEGRGSTFDGINPANGYHPLWMLINVPIFALARFDLVLPLRVLVVVLGLLSAGTGILLYRILGRAAHPVIGALAAGYWVFDLQNFTRVYKPGLETGIAAFTFLLLVHLLQTHEARWRNGETTNKHIALIGIAAVLVMFSRLDLMFLAAIIGLWVVFRKQTLRYLLPLDITSMSVAVFLAFILRLGMREYYRFADAALALLVVSLLFGIPAAYFLGLYRRDVLRAPLQLTGRLALLAAGVAVLAGGSIFVLTPLLGFEGFPRAVVPLHAALTFAALGLPRYTMLLLGVRNAAPEPSPLELLKSNWKKWLNDGLVYYGVVFGALGVYMLINKVLFGTFSPISGQIKRWWGSFPGFVYGGTAKTPTAFFGIEPGGHSNAWQPVTSVLGVWAEGAATTTGYEAEQVYLLFLVVFALLVFIVLFFNRQQAKRTLMELAFLPLAAAGVLQVLSYHATGYAAFRDWYWVIQPLLVILLLGSVAYWRLRPLSKRNYAVVLGWALVLTLGFLQWDFLFANVRGFMQYGRWTADTPNSEIAAFLEARTEPGSIIGMTGGGTAGYFIQDRTVVNMDGLINRLEYYQAVRAGEGGEFLLDLGMDYALVNLDFVTRQPYNGQFNPYMETMNEYVHVFELFRYGAP